jgi:transposase-like protein
VLVAIGTDTKGKRSILRVSVSLSEVEPHWKDFLASLAARVNLVVADSHAGSREALKARLVGLPWQRRQFHLIENAHAFVPKTSMRMSVVASLRSVFNARGRAAVGHRCAQVWHERSEAG